MLQEVEANSVSKSCRDADSAQRYPPPPKRPEEPRKPGLYHLRDVGGDVKLPWSWDCESGLDFLDKWNTSITEEEFRVTLKDLAYWWIRKKVRDTVHYLL